MVKKLVLLLISSVILGSCSTICTGGWTKIDTTWELADQGLMATDWLQTQKIVEQPLKYHETNPILGVHPSMAKLNIYFALWVPVHIGVSCILPPKTRRIWQIGTALIEIPAIISNESIGLKP